MLEKIGMSNDPEEATATFKEQELRLGTITVEQTVLNPKVNTMDQALS
jgi:hypothetical protein